MVIEQQTGDWLVHQVGRLLAGSTPDPQEALELIRQHLRVYVFHQVARFGGDADQIEDAALEVWVELWQAMRRRPAEFAESLRRFGVGGLVRYLARIAGRVAGRARSAPLETGGFFPDDLPDDRDWAEPLIDPGDRERFWRIVAECDRHGCLRLAAEGYSGAEIGQQLGITPAAAKTCVHRARQAARRELQAQGLG